MLRAMSEEPKATAGPDEYQAKFMGAGALYHDKIRVPRLFHLIFLLPVIIGVGSGVAAATQAGILAALPGALGALVVMASWLLFSVLRISVTREEVYVQYGLFGPRIAVRDIEHCAAVAYDWKKYGGFGIRLGRDGSVAYNMMGDHGRAVEIVYQHKGKSKKVLVASPDPERLSRAINEARALAGASAAPKRIAEVPEVAEAPSAAADASSEALLREAEAEAEAIAAEAERQAKG